MIVLQTLLKLLLLLQVCTNYVASYLCLVIKCYYSIEEDDDSVVFVIVVPIIVLIVFLLFLIVCSTLCVLYYKLHYKKNPIQQTLDTPVFS